MKKFFAIMALLSTAVCANAEPRVTGNVLFNEHIVLIDRRVACSSESMSSTDVNSVVYGEYSLIEQDGDSFQLIGRLNGDLVSISGKVSGQISLHLIEKTANGKPSYSFMSAGRFAGDSGDNVHLSVLLNERRINIDCFLLK
jgi:hypothetical protein